MHLRQDGCLGQSCDRLGIITSILGPIFSRNWSDILPLKLKLHRSTFLDKSREFFYRRGAGIRCDRRCSLTKFVRRTLARSESDSNALHESDEYNVLASLRTSADFDAMMTTLEAAQ